MSHEQAEPGRRVTWAAVPTDDDVADAARFLTLLGVPGPLTADPRQWLYPAKDLLRAARLSMLSKGNAGVRKWTGRLRDHEVIPPVLLRVGSLSGNRPLILAEGYHRVCACYLRGEDTEVGCHFLVGSPTE